MARLRSRGARSLTTLSPILTSPPVMSSSPTIIRRIVDFPQPDGPTRIMNSPSAMSRFTSRTVGESAPGKVFSMWSRRMLATRRPLSALDRAGREAGDDLALEDEDERDDRDGHDHRGGRDG